MAKEIYTITCSSLPDSARVAGFRGTEAISGSYEMHVYILLGADGNDLDLADVVGAKAKLALDRDDDRPPFVFHGIFSAFELLHDFDGRSLFHAVLVPQLWQLTQTLHSRIWTKKSIKDIIQQVLEDGGLSGGDFEFQLVQTYKPEEHVCQYQESDFDFISRWMEREGMYYYFEQGESGEKLIISDSKAKQRPLDDTPVRFFAVAGHDGSAGESLNTFTCKHQALPATVKLRDYDYAKPTLSVAGEAPISNAGLGEIVVYGHRFFTPDDGKRLAKLRAEERLARQAVYRGTGTEFHLRAGYVFELTDHPRPAFDQKYLAIEVEHVGNQQLASPEMRALTGIESDKVYHVEVTAIPADTQFRPRLATAWPRIYGLENGTICGGADSDYAQIDDHGRYNVKFKFDESDLKNGTASTWVRMMQPHGGNPEGFHFPLRKGTEVVFSFLGGDPDRPVIAGVVPDTTNPSPVTSSNHTKNVIHTGGDNRFELEDLAGQQRVTLQTPTAKTHLLMGHPKDGYEFIAKTEGNSLHHTDKNHDHKIGGDGTRTTDGDHDEETKGKHTFTIGDNWEVTVGEDKKEIVIGSTTEILIGKKDETIIGSKTELVVGAESGTHISTSKEVTMGDKTEIDFANGLEIVMADKTGITIGNSTETTIGNKTETTIGNTTEVHVGDKNETHNGNSIEHTTGLTLETFVGAKAELQFSAVAELALGLKAGLFVGGAMEIFVGGLLEIFAGGKHEITTEKDEMHAVKQTLAGLRQATIGCANAACGANTSEAAIEDIAAGLKASTAGLTALN